MPSFRPERAPYPQELLTAAINECESFDRMNESNPYRVHIGGDEDYVQFRRPIDPITGALLPTLSVQQRVVWNLHWRSDRLHQGAHYSIYPESPEWRQRALLFPPDILRIQRGVNPLPYPLPAHGPNALLRPIAWKTPRRERSRRLTRPPQAFPGIRRNPRGV